VRSDAKADLKGCGFFLGMIGFMLVLTMLYFELQGIPVHQLLGGF
jgi:hypothetical protein